jgi:hypothetical protein
LVNRAVYFPYAGIWGRAGPEKSGVDLLAYKNKIETTQEWPFDSSTLLRFSIYMLIPIGSMAGGALVERAVNLLLD